MQLAGSIDRSGYRAGREPYVILLNTQHARREKNESWISGLGRESFSSLKNFSPWQHQY
jgi:hypothetical protein